MPPRPGARVAEITGLLLAAGQSRLCPGISQDPKTYHNLTSADPHQSTADQFFDEMQFEAYRELGYQAGRALGKEPRFQNLLAQLFRPGISN